MKLGNTIRIRRNALKMTQEQVAERLGVTAPAVHKWEKGASFPDVTLLPALARLLDVDMNELFSFHEELGSQDIKLLTEDAIRQMQDGHFQEAAEMLLKYTREYPDNALLLEQCAAVLDSGRIAYAAAEKETYEKYEDVILELYQRAADVGTGKTRDAALYMLSAKLSAKGDYSGAEEALNKLPEVTYDKRVLKANLARQKGDVAEAIHIMENCLLANVNDVVATLTHLANCFDGIGQTDLKQLCIDHIRELTCSFELWKGNLVTLKLDQAMKQKSKEKTLLALQELIEVVKKPYNYGDYPLFHEADTSEVQMGAYIIPPLKAMVENGNGLDEEGFLKGDADVLKLFEEIS